MFQWDLVPSPFLSNKTTIFSFIRIPLLSSLLSFLLLLFAPWSYSDLLYIFELIWFQRYQKKYEEEKQQSWKNIVESKPNGRRKMSGKNVAKKRKKVANRGPKEKSNKRRINRDGFGIFMKRLQSKMPTKHMFSKSIKNFILSFILTANVILSHFYFLLSLPYLDELYLRKIIF